MRRNNTWRPIWCIIKDMRTIHTTALVAISIVFLGALAVASHAERFRYMDGSGNIRFADSIDQVPRQYRQQIYPPTPTPVLDKRAQTELRRAKEKEENRRIHAEREKKREAEKRRADLEKKRLREERELRRQEEASSLIRSGR